MVGTSQTKWSEMGEEKMLNLMRREIVEQSDRFNKDRSFDPSAWESVIYTCLWEFLFLPYLDGDDLCSRKLYDATGLR